MNQDFNSAPGGVQQAPNYSAPYTNEAPYSQPQPAAPVGQLKTNRSFLKVFLLGIITLGIYPIVAYSSVSNDINIIAGRYDGKKTMHYCLLIFIIIPVTLGIGGIVWTHKISDRIGNELKRRNIDYKFDASTFWLWAVLGSLLFGIGPIVYAVKLFHSMNLLSENYNQFG